jgi:cell division protein FtsB
MPWFAWLFMALAFGAVVGSLLLLRDSANKMPLSEEELQRMRERNAQLEAQARKDDDEDE